ncbi:hypothetical protein QF032_001351 [Streptomyces achromogenes]|uniref:hypothetical protein n=1 Tax=Streptomyces achromogenes TaxID=67255 RepID=UPI00277DDE3F|nr:hypothetical protein [Streptomyces achromogenes]MDQ0829507.1 hypothetical protein [Streptomyces achromogenes]
MIWLVLLCAVLAALVVLAADDARWDHRRLPPVTQRRPQAPSPPQASPSGPWHPGFHLQRGRRVRAARARRRQQP